MTTNRFQPGDFSRMPRSWTLDYVPPPRPPRFVYFRPRRNGVDAADTPDAPAERTRSKAKGRAA